MRVARLLILIAVLAGILVACQDTTDVGSRDLLDIKEEQEAERRIGDVLKESPQPNESPVTGAIGQPSPTPSQDQKVQTVEIGLIHDDPYFTIDGNPNNEIVVSAGSILKVVNNDDRTRQFAAESGAFTSPALEPGQAWEYKAGAKGEFRLRDEYVPFVFGILRVV